MNFTDFARLHAPVDYGDVRTRVNTVRAGAALAMIGLSIAIWAREGTPTVVGLAAGGLFLADALWRRSHSSPAVYFLLVDATLAGGLSLLHNASPLAALAAFLYIVTGALLLLRPLLASAVIGYIAAWTAIGTLAGPHLDETTGLLHGALTESAIVGAFTVLIITLLVSAVQALNESTRRHQMALAAERRAVELKDEFVSMVSHEFRTPLTSLAGFSETLRANWDELDPAEIEEFLIIMRQEAHHLSDLVEDILVIPRLEAGRLRLHLEELDLAGEIHAMARLVFADTGMDVDIAIPGGVMVRADRGRVGQVLRNLMDNSRKYGGDQVQIEGEAGSDTYIVSVSDNGPGIDQEDSERIFEHFEQTSKGDARTDQGVGLGLPIARKLARAMGGDVWYVPRFPIGASFRFSMHLSRIIHDASLHPVKVDTQPSARIHERESSAADSTAAAKPPITVDDG